MKKTGLIGSVLVWVLLLGMHSSAFAEEPLEDLQLKAYLSLVKGDAARDKTRTTEAIDHYKRAHRYYQKVKKQDPAFRPDIVEYRLRYCASQTAQLEQQMAASATGAPAADNAKADALMQENTYLRKRIGEMERDTEITREVPKVEVKPKTVETPAPPTPPAEDKRAQEQIDKLSEVLSLSEAQHKVSTADAEALKKQLAQLQKQALTQQKELAEEALRQKQANLKLMQRAETLEQQLSRADQSGVSERALELQVKNQEDLLMSLKKERTELKAQLDKAMRTPEAATSASGFSPLRTALKRMEAMEKTIGELEETVGERESRLATLERKNKELEKITRATEKSGGLFSRDPKKVLEKNQREMTTLKAELNEARQTMRSLEKQASQGKFADRAMADLTLKKKELKTLSEQLEQLEKANRKLQEQADKAAGYRDERDQAHSRLKKLSGPARDADRLQAKLDELELENRTYNERISALNEEIGSLRKSNKALEKNIARLQSDQASDTPKPKIKVTPEDQRSIQAMEAELAALRQSKEKSRSAIRQVMTKLEEYKAYVERLKATNQTRIDALVKQIDDLNRKNEALQSSAE